LALREILAKFGFEYDKPKLKEVDRGIQSTKDTLTGVLKTLAGVAFLNGVKNFIGGIEQLGSHLNDLSEQTGVSTDSIQLFQFITGQAGVEAEEASAAIRKLSVSLGKAAEGGGDQAAAFTELGIAFQDSSGGARKLDDVLPELFASFGAITDDGKAARLAVDLFGKSGVKMLGALKQGAPGFEAFRAEFEALGGGLSAEAIAAADEYGDSLFKLNFAFTGIKSVIGAEVFPMLTGLIGHFTTAVGWVRKMAKGTEMAKGLMIALGITGVAAIVALLAPFAPVIAAISVLTLLFDDLINFIEGNDSVIGAALNGIFGEGTAGKVRAGLQDIGKAVSEFFTDLLKHPIKFKEDLELLFKGLSNDVRKFLGMSVEDSGIALPDSQKRENAARRQTESEDTIPTFGSKGLTEMIGNDWLLNKLGVVDFRTFGKKSARADTPSAPFTATSAGPQGEVPVPTPGAPLPVKVETGSVSSGDWFSRIADSFGNFVGLQQTAALPAAAVPGSVGAPVNTVQQTNTNHFHVSAGTPAEVSSAVEKGVTGGLGNERRNALAQLENRGGN
jgi:hypothetical protein